MEDRENPNRSPHQALIIRLDGMEPLQNKILLVDDPISHKIEIIMDSILHKDNTVIPVTI